MEVKEKNIPAKKCHPKIEALNFYSNMYVMRKAILGLDLGTTSIGWAFVTEAENPAEVSEINDAGVRVNPLTTDEQTNFGKGNPVTVNADRTLKRSMRRNLDRYQLRRRHLVEILEAHGLINNETILAENGRQTTHATWRSRALAASEQISTDEFARTLLTINKKRGYKSSRKVKNEDEGQIIDGMAVARRLYDEQLTPGQLALQLLQEGKKHLPDFYRSDLKNELDNVWEFQKQYYPEILTDDFKNHLEGKGHRATSAAFWHKHGFNIADNKGTRDERKMQAYTWRSQALSTQLDKEIIGYVITEINNELNKSSGYLGAISDRSKALYFNKETVGQYLYTQIQGNPHVRVKGQTFYRQDYLDEFEQIWETQAKYDPRLTPALKEEIRDIVIFYQRKLRSQKSQISFCEFESKEIVIEKNGHKTTKRIGLRVCPKSSPLFQEFKIWQVLNNLQFRIKRTKEVLTPDLEAKTRLFNELNIKGNLSASAAAKILGYKSASLEANYATLEGNRTHKMLYDAYLKILESEGYDETFLKYQGGDDIDVSKMEQPAEEIQEMVRSIFKTLGINTDILHFDAELDGKQLEEQASYRLWHLLYAYEGDDSPSGNEHLYTLLNQKFGFKKEHAQILAQIPLDNGYGNLSSKAMRKIIVFLKDGFAYAGRKDNPMEPSACEYAGYKHSAASLTKEEIINRPLQPRLCILKKNELRNPVVEKILNQMVNVVNTVIDEENAKRKAQGLPGDFRFDEIRIELSRELKKNAAERAEMTSNINAAKAKYDSISKLLQQEFGVKNPSRNDIIRYKLYEELKNNGYKDLYTNTYIPREILFSKSIDVDHIIPQMTLFDDSFSNKTIIFRKDNQEKGNKTAYDYILGKFGETAAEEFTNRITLLFESNRKNREEGIGKAKFQKLQKRLSEIGDGFIERDLRESQYIARKAKSMLLTICRSVVATSGEITAKLRSDWGLMHVMQEINMPKFRALKLTEVIDKKDGGQSERIIDWNKRNDHRHHAMDAITIAFTKHNHIQYLNYLNARKDVHHKMHGNIIAIENKETELVYDDVGNRKRKFKTPTANFRESVREHLAQILVSHKAKNKVVTKNNNKTRSKNGGHVKVELTPRGQLHKETIYGEYRYYESKEEKIGTRFDENIINMVANPNYRKLLLARLLENGNDPKKAFGGKNSINKTPIYLDDTKQNVLPDKVKLTWLKTDYSIKKEVTPENFKDEKSIEKVLDNAVKQLLLKRLELYGDAKKAFSDLDRNPIWLNKEKGIAVKRVKISGIKNAESLHYKKDHLGNDILDNSGRKIPTSFVSTGNNHHVAIYRDAEGNLQEKVVSLFDAVQLTNAGEPVIDSTYNQGIGWRFLFTMKQNEYFVFPNDQTGFDPGAIDLLNPENRKAISPNLFRVQKISTKNYCFRHHLETTVEEKKELKDITYKPQLGLNAIKSIVKVRLNHVGKIIGVGEY